MALHEGMEAVLFSCAVSSSLSHALSLEDYFYYKMYNVTTPGMGTWGGMCIFSNLSW